ncbi:MAG: hypothetical protein BA863_10330 [Desulfovibrio sp. S3730MH75]|nr:MAG: hypothetical protein BA863_10330 [Desulfovibrio sp. S3730MH75]
MKTIFIKKDTWIEALPDRLVLPCSVCGCRVDFDYTINDAFWKKVVSSKYIRDVVCLHCLDVMAVAKRENIHEHLEKIHYCGEGKTIELCANTVYFEEK